jgi:hypothetical protein
MRCTDILRDDADSDLFASVTKKLAHERSLFDRDAILSAVDAAIRVGSEESAAALIDFYIKRYPGDYEIRLRRADAAARFGHPKKALQIARWLFDSPASVAVKRDALFRVASLEYRLDRQGRAAESYRLFGMYYPGDRRSTWALDTAARIELARRNRKRALSIWRVVRERGSNSRIARQAALSEAVLRYDCGEREPSQRILEDLLSASDGMLEAAVLYWLVRVEGETEQASVWRARLFRTYPHSFYTAALRGNARRLLQAAARGGDGTERFEQVERDTFAFLSSRLPPDSALFDHPAYGAFRYLLERGLLEEAEAFGNVLRQLFGGEKSVMLAVYHEARRQGLVRLSLETLNSASLCCAGDRVPPALFYPAAFTSVIAREALARGLPPELILAVIREESKFDAHAVSPASARGLMQLMPSTGSWIGSKLGRGKVGGDDLFEPQFNIEAGTWYLAYLLDRCGGSIPAALAAYNAGAAKTSEWRKSFRPAEKPMVAIELIGLRETREYVRRVLDTMFAYRSILKENQGLP